MFQEPMHRVLKKIKNEPSSNDQIRWQETLRDAIKTFIANTTKTRDTPQKIVEICGTIWTSWSEKES